MYDFHPGHQVVCHLNNRLNNDFGLLSYLAPNQQLLYRCPPTSNPL